MVLTQVSLKMSFLLYQSYRLPRNYYVRSLQDNRILLTKNIDNFTIFNKLPPLIKGYLRAVEWLVKVFI